jgi:ribosomal protein S18 acetylase RimI-like enzyme
MIVRQAGLDDLDDLARLFDMYRGFYRQPPDVGLARRYLGERLARGESIVFLALEGDDAFGFTQLYRSFCSVAAAPILILYDLYVDAPARGRGVATALMDRARAFGESTGAVRIELETAIDNVTAQKVYERHGYVRNTTFHKYALTL